MSSVSGYDIAAAVLYGLAIPVLLVLFLVSLVTVHHRNDPIRLPFLWLKLAMPFFIISVILSTADEIILLVIESLDGNGSLSLYEANWRIFDLSELFSNLADNIILLCLVELGLSFLRFFGKVGIYQQIIRYSTVFLVVVLFALTFSIEGTYEDDITKSDYGANYDVDWTTVCNLFAAYYILYWILSLPVVVLSAIALYFSIRNKYLQSSFFIILSSKSVHENFLLTHDPSAQLAACFLAASLFNLTRTTWDLAYAIQYDINYVIYLTYIPLFVIVLFPILYVWVTVVLFTLVIVIGTKKINGLWSNQQQFYGNSGQGQGIPVSQPVGPTSYMQPSQPGIVVGAPNVWTPELNGNNSIKPSQQYYGTQYQQQQPIFQNQVPQAYHVAGT